MRKKINWTKEELIGKEYLGVEQAAVYANRSVATIRQWITLDVLPHTSDEFGYRLMLKTTDIDKHLEDIKNGVRRSKKRGPYKKKSKDETEKNLESVKIGETDE